MAKRARTTPKRPLIDRSQPRGIVFYPYYTVPEVAQIMGISPDKVTSLCKQGQFGKLVEFNNQRQRPHLTRIYTTRLIPFEALFRILPDNSEVA